MEKEFVLEGLHCASCAGRIESGLAARGDVGSVSVNLANATLTLRGEALPEDIAEEVVRVVRRVEPEARVREKGQPEAAQAPAPRRRRLNGERAGLLAGAFLFAVGMALPLQPRSRMALLVAAYLLLGWKVVLRAFQNLARGRLFDENFLMSLATFGAFAIGEAAEAAGVMLFYQAGEALQEAAVRRSRRSIADLMDIRPDQASVERDGVLRTVNPEEVLPGERIVLRPGEKVPLDGVVEEGDSLVDTVALTGESVPRRARPGDGLYSGSVNLSGVLRIRVTRAFGDSTATRILRLVEDAAARKAPAENFITRFSRFYTPAVVAVAALLASLPPLLTEAPWEEWINRGLIFLVISCPCALVISIPLGFFGGIGGASRRGVLVKGGNYLEALSRADTVVFDKTGTLTKGVFEVTQLSPVQGVSPAELLALAAHAEAHSGHPIARSIRSAWGAEPDPDAVSDYEEIPGFGVRAQVNGQVVLAGSGRLMERYGISYEAVPGPEPRVYVARDGVFLGSLRVSDELKPDSAEAVRQLRALGVKRLVMLTGDGEAVARETGAALGLDEVHAGLLPQDKVVRLEALEKDRAGRGTLIFVGDGINDAPVLARADVGVAMGGLGSDAAIEAADVVLMTDEPSRLPEAIRTARHTRRIVWQNIAFALSVKGLFLLLGALGVAQMWEAVFADVGVAVLAVLNAMRAMGSPARA